MKILYLSLALLLTNSYLMAKSENSCYSIQLTSFAFKQNSNYKFEEQGYPSTCKLIKFTDMNAVRCGCFDKYEAAKTEQKKFISNYKKAKIVTTYKYRFTPNKSIANTILDTNKDENPNFIEEYKKPTKSVNINNSQQATIVTEDKENKNNEYISREELNLDESTSFINNFSTQGYVDLTSQYYIDKSQGKHPSNFTASSGFEIAYVKDDFQAFAKLKAQQDYYDFVGGNNKNDRSFIRIDELYTTYNFENNQIMFGKNIRFWGALEVRNITDGFNPDDLRSDVFETDKLGVWNATYTYFTETGELSSIIKFYEQDRKLSNYPYVYYFFPSTLPISSGTEVPFTYDDKLIAEKSQSRPSIYLKYTDSTNTKYAIDYAFVYENGYDSQRYYTKTLAADGASIRTNENVYLVNKLSTYNTLVLGPTLIKLEALYTDVIYNDVISDYYHIGLGIEHTLTQIYKDADLGLIFEYYKYGTLEDYKRDDLELFELFQNDLFLGLRYSFNQGNDMSILAGGIFDLDYNEQVYYVEYEGRVVDTLKINIDYRYIAPSSGYATAFNLMGKHQKVSLKIGYYF